MVFFVPSDRLFKVGIASAIHAPLGIVRNFVREFSLISQKDKNYLVLATYLYFIHLNNYHLNVGEVR